MTVCMSPVEYINWVRIRTACGELKRTNDTVGDIAVRCGFPHCPRSTGISTGLWAFRHNSGERIRSILNRNC